jgi:hypothetical protein
LRSGAADRKTSPSRSRRRSEDSTASTAATVSTSGTITLGAHHGTTSAGTQG